MAGCSAKFPESETLRSPALHQPSHQAGQAQVLLTELFEHDPTQPWALVRQAGVSHSVALMQGAEQQARWLGAQSTGDAPELLPIPDRGQRPWEEQGLRALQRFHADRGFTLTVVEDTAPMDLVRLGLPGRDEQISHVIDQIEAMGVCGIPVLCYNWMAMTSWARTHTDVVLRGGARSTGYEDAQAQAAAPLVQDGEVTDEQLWSSLSYFLEAVVPVAEASGVRLALHPDDPPVPMMRGLPRIISSIAAYRRVVQLVPSRSNAITLCQGNVTLMTDDLPSVIREFGSADQIAFVHFRDVLGTVTRFVETFHDEGRTDMFACLQAYREVGFTGPMRPDHVPSLEGEDNAKPGYAAMGRLFALGYIAGLREAVYSHRPGRDGPASVPDPLAVGGADHGISGNGG
ncbi:MAG: mannonate dehydratase [Glaciecola sp.]|jgi:mannonate dehydratase